MRTRAAVLAPVAGALAFAVAGCGGGGNGSAAGTVGGSASGSATTTTGQGGVLGARGNLGQARAHVEIGRVQAILNGSLNRLMHTRSKKQLTHLATRTSAQLRAEAQRIQNLNVPSGAQQAQRNLVGSLQSVATDIDTIKGDVQHDNWSAALGAATHLSSVTALRASLQSFKQALRNTHGAASGSATVSTPMTTASTTTTAG